MICIYVNGIASSVIYMQLVLPKLKEAILLISH
jgi:hypothetical protein